MHRQDVAGSIKVPWYEVVENNECFGESGHPWCFPFGIISVIPSTGRGKLDAKNREQVKDLCQTVSVNTQLLGLRNLKIANGSALYT